MPVLHYTLELACYIRRTLLAINPDCVAVELPCNCEEVFLHAAARLPDISVITLGGSHKKYFLAEPCDPIFEALRSSLECQIPAYCIDCDVNDYPFVDERLPDPYAITKIGLSAYYGAYRNTLAEKTRLPLDEKRELFMAKKLKELTLRYDRVLFIGGFFHVEKILSYFEKNCFPEDHLSPQKGTLSTLTEESCRDNLAEYGYLTSVYENWREDPASRFPNRQKILFDLYKQAGENYKKETGFTFSYHLNNLMKFSRNYALYSQKLTPNLFMILQAARGCVDHNYAYEVWKLATAYPYLKNIDNLQELPLTVDELWGASKKVIFNLKQKQKKGLQFSKRKKDLPHTQFQPPASFAICSYPPEDLAIESFGAFLKQKSLKLINDENRRVLPFFTSLEDGIDVRESLRHFYEKKLYVKIQRKPPAALGSVCVIFDEDKSEMAKEKFPWKTTWIGENSQESDMAFFATEMHQNVVGPGISRCQYGGFMLSYPPRRLWDVWTDPDYERCGSKAEVLLLASIDYCLDPLIVYVAKTPPKQWLKSYASRFGKKIFYIPIGGLSPNQLNQIRIFHVLEGKDKREIAGDYIF